MKFVLPFCLAAFVALPAAAPTILVIYTDDHGWADLGAQGVDRDIRTPIRITPGKECAGVEIQSIERLGQGTKPQIWHFGSPD